jgi:hypothetical protein
MRLLMALVLPCAMIAAPAAAEPLDRLLSTPGIAPLPEASALLYRHRRADRHDAGGEEAFERTIRLERHTQKTSVIATLDGGDTAHPLAEFRGTTGNPIALLFIESVVSRISQASASNPFYLRKRINEAMQGRRDERPVSAGHGGANVAAQEVTLRPFEGDQHAQGLGVFAALELTFLLSDAVPGGLVSLRATVGEAPGGYFEEIHLHGTS